jgi:hypothetical protein
MHTAPNAHDAPIPDPDVSGHDARAHYAPPQTVTRYVVEHHGRQVSPEYDTMSEAELFRAFETPGTDDYRVRLVNVPTTPRTA